MKQLWPTSFWERGDIDAEGKQLWYGRKLTPNDHDNRRDYEAKVEKLRSERH